MNIQCGFCNKLFDSKYTETERKDINRKLAQAKSTMRAFQICPHCWDNVIKTFGKTILSNQN